MMKRQRFFADRGSFKPSVLVSLGALVIFGCHTTSQKADAPANVSQAVTAEKKSDKKDASPIPEVTVIKPETSAKSGIRLRPYEEHVLRNGLHILFVEDASLPYISYSLMVKGGTSSDPADLPGLSSIVADLLETGTVKRSATQIAEDFGHKGAEFESSISSDETVLATSCLSMDAEDVLDLFHEVVTQPSFTESEFARIRKHYQAEIQKRQDSPEAFASVAWEKYFYGQHPYGHPGSGTAKSLAQISKKNIIQQYLKYYRPSNSILAVVGKFQPSLVAKIEKVWGAWPNKDVAPVAFPALAVPDGRQILLVEKEGLVQSQIRIGTLGIKRQDSDYLTLRVANTILGGAFDSRLVNHVRKELGLTYSISSSFDARLDYGPFEISTFTKNNSVGQTLQETLKVLTEFYEKGVTDKEVTQAKGYMRGTFPAAIETAEKLAFNLVNLRIYGVSDRYLSDFTNNLDDVSASDVNKVIKRHFDPAHLKIVVYSTKEAEPMLTQLGKLEIKSASDVE